MHGGGAILFDYIKRLSMLAIKIFFSKTVESKIQVFPYPEISCTQPLKHPRQKLKAVLVCKPFSTHRQSAQSFSCCTTWWKMSQQVYFATISFFSKWLRAHLQIFFTNCYCLGRGFKLLEHFLHGRQKYAWAVSRIRWTHKNVLSVTFMWQFYLLILAFFSSCECAL